MPDPQSRNCPDFVAAHESGSGPSPTSRNVHCAVAFGGKADIGPDLLVHALVSAHRRRRRWCFLGPNDLQETHIGPPELLSCGYAQPCSKAPFGLAHRARSAGFRYREKRSPCVFAFLTAQHAGCLSKHVWRLQHCSACLSRFNNSLVSFQGPSVPSAYCCSDGLCILSVVGMIFGKDRDQLLRGGIPPIPKRLRVALPPRRRRATYAMSVRHRRARPPRRQAGLSLIAGLGWLIMRTGNECQLWC
jgi:hypothetical protein